MQSYPGNGERRAQSGYLQQYETATMLASCHRFAGLIGLVR